VRYEGEARATPIIGSLSQWWARLLTQGRADETSRFTEEQMIAALKEHAAGAPAKELWRRLGAYGGIRRR
jgi:hypothetical protein